jgi:hypothetical protein
MLTARLAVIEDPDGDRPNVGEQPTHAKGIARKPVAALTAIGVHPGCQFPAETQIFVLPPVSLVDKSRNCVPRFYTVDNFQGCAFLPCRRSKRGGQSWGK